MIVVTSKEAVQPGLAKEGGAFLAAIYLVEAELGVDPLAYLAWAFTRLGTHREASPNSLPPTRGRLRRRPDAADHRTPGTPLVCFHPGVADRSTRGAFR